MAKSNVVSIAFFSSCCVAFLLSVGGIISAFWALNVDQRWDKYETTGSGTAITFDGRLDEYSGWWFSPVPRVIHDGNERAVAGSSVTILALSLLMVILISIRGSVTKVYCQDVWWAFRIADCIFRVKRSTRRHPGSLSPIMWYIL